MKKAMAFLVILTMALGISSGAMAKKKKSKKSSYSQGLGAPKTNKNYPTKKEKVKFKKFNENDPTRTSDNTITVEKGGQPVDVPIKQNWGEKHLRIFKNQDVNLTTTYDPETGDYTVSNVEPFITY